jgi:hypothetical protein
VRLRIPFFITVFALATLGLGGVPAPARAATKRPPRAIVAFKGKISRLKNGRDRTKKRYWEYRLRTAAGKTILVHDYRYGRYRQPASMGIREGASRSVRGFFVHISTKRGRTTKAPVLIVSPAN